MELNEKEWLELMTKNKIAKWVKHEWMDLVPPFSWARGRTRREILNEKND